MFPVDESVYKKVKFDINNKMSKSDSQRTFLMIKEYNFLKEISEEIGKKVTKIYDKQITKSKVLKYHCDYRKLEKAFDENIELYYKSYENVLKDSISTILDTTDKEIIEKINDLI